MEPDLREPVGPAVRRVRVLGVDPGTRKAGLVAVDEHGRLLFHRAVALNGDSVPARLLELYRAVSSALERSKAAILAIENPAHPRNARNAQLLGRAVGVCLLAAAQRGIITLEYRPAQLKKARTQVGRRWRTGRWSDDEVSAASTALLALSEPVEEV